MVRGSRGNRLLLSWTAQYLNDVDVGRMEGGEDEEGIVRGGTWIEERGRKRSREKAPKQVEPKPIGDAIGGTRKPSRLRQTLHACGWGGLGRREESLRTVYMTSLATPAFNLEDLGISFQGVYAKCILD